jgi:hypothetical protein
MEQPEKASWFNLHTKRFEQVKSHDDTHTHTHSLSLSLFSAPRNNKSAQILSTMAATFS